MRGSQSPVDSAYPTIEGVEHRTVYLPGPRMHVAEAGSGEPVVLLHGFPQHWWEWRRVIPGLADHYRVICPDLRGAGWTEAPAAAYTSDQLLADVVALLDVLELRRVHLIAHDWGALVGFRLCLDHPDRVKGYVSLAIPHPYITFDPRLLFVLRHAWYQLVIAPPVLGPHYLSKGDQRLPRYLFRHFTSDPSAWAEEDIELFIAKLRDPARARAGSALYRNFIMREPARMFAGLYRGTRLAVPTRVLIGADDPVVRQEFLSRHEAYADDLMVHLVSGA